MQNTLAGGIIYTTMMPCPMCAGAIIRFGVKAVVVAETQTYADSGTKPFMEQQGIDVTVLDALESIAMMEEYYEQNPEHRQAYNSDTRLPLKL